MPELPEVETWARRLRRRALGQRLRTVDVLDAAVVRTHLSTRPSDRADGDLEKLEAWVGQPLVDVLRRSKRLALCWGDGALGVHLGMTGRWVFSGLQEPPPRHARLGLGFEDVVAWFVDTRRFGCVVVYDRPDWRTALGEGLGPEPWPAPVPPEDLAARFATRRAIKPALLDQNRIAGMGNIHAAEALFRAQINPFTPAMALDTAQWDRLSGALCEQLAHAIEALEALPLVTYITEQGGDGEAEGFQVYGREGQPCVRCAAPIERQVQSGRATYWCPMCQPG